VVGPTLFTQVVVPGQTMDGVFTWTGKGLGWDIYGTTDMNPHICDDPLIDPSNPDQNGDGVIDGADCEGDDCFDSTTHEWCPDHDKPVPVELPQGLSLAFGGMYSGSPYLGALGGLPPGEGGLNPNAGFAYMWHSHVEKVLLNNDIFPGGMGTFIIIEPWPAP
jgi:hypothetical protein